MNEDHLDFNRSPLTPDSVPSFDPFKASKTDNFKDPTHSQDQLTIDRLQSENSYLKRQLAALEQRFSTVSEQLESSRKAPATQNQSRCRHPTTNINIAMFNDEDELQDLDADFDADPMDNEDFLSVLYDEPTPNEAPATTPKFEPPLPQPYRASPSIINDDDWFAKSKQPQPVTTWGATDTTSATSSSSSQHYNQYESPIFAPPMIDTPTGKRQHTDGVADVENVPEAKKQRRHSISSTSGDAATRDRLGRKTSLEPEQDIEPQSAQAHRTIGKGSRGRRPQAKNQNSETRKFRCDTCGQFMRDKYNLLHHMMVHTGDRPYKCPLCERGFSRINLRRQHMEQEHGVPMVKYSRQHTFDALIEEARKKQQQPTTSKM